MATPNWLECYLAILCAYIETQNPAENMKADIVAVYHGMPVDRSLKILRYVSIAAAP